MTKQELREKARARCAEVLRAALRNVDPPSLSEEELAGRWVVYLTTPPDPRAPRTLLGNGQEWLFATADRARNIWETAIFRYGVMAATAIKDVRAASMAQAAPVVGATPETDSRPGFAGTRRGVEWIRANAPALGEACGWILGNAPRPWGHTKQRAPHADYDA